MNFKKEYLHLMLSSSVIRMSNLWCLRPQFQVQLLLGLGLAEGVIDLFIPCSATQSLSCAWKSSIDLGHARIQIPKKGQVSVDIDHHEQCLTLLRMIYEKVLLWPICVSSRLQFQQVQLKRLRQWLKWNPSQSHAYATNISVNLFKNTKKVTVETLLSLPFVTVVFFKI